MKNILDRDLHVILLIIGSLMMIYSAFYGGVLLGCIGCIIVGIYLIIDILHRYYRHEQIIRDLINKEGDKNDENNIL